MEGFNCWFVRVWGEGPVGEVRGTEGRKRDCRVCFLFRGPEGEVTIAWDG